MAVHTLVKIVIPLYRLPLSQAEETAIKHTARILQSYPICFIIPEGLPKAPLERLIPQAGIMSVSNHWLGRENGISGYNDMMMSKDFYSLFADTEYILICQPDAWIFRDELEKWCRKSYDYIGAPWIRPEKYDRFLPQLWLRLQKFPAYRHKQARPFRQSGERRAIFTANKFIYRGLRKIRKRNYPIQKTLPPSLQRRRILGDNSSQFQIPDCPRSVGIRL